MRTILRINPSRAQRKGAARSQSELFPNRPETISSTTFFETEHIIMSSFTDSLIAHDFPSFARQCHKICRGGETLDNDPYLLHVFAMAEDIADGRVTKAIINMPPGTAKSFIM